MYRRSISEPVDLVYQLSAELGQLGADEYVRICVILLGDLVARNSWSRQGNDAGALALRTLAVAAQIAAGAGGQRDAAQLLTDWDRYGKQHAPSFDCVEIATYALAFDLTGRPLSRAAGEAIGKAAVDLDRHAYVDPITTVTAYLRIARKVYLGPQQPFPGSESWAS